MKKALYSILLCCLLSFEATADEIVTLSCHSQLAISQKDGSTKTFEPSPSSIVLDLTRKKISFSMGRFKNCCELYLSDQHRVSFGNATSASPTIYGDIDRVTGDGMIFDKTEAYLITVALKCRVKERLF